MRPALVVAFLATLSSPMMAQDHSHDAGGTSSAAQACESQRIGEVSFANSGSRAAQSSFQRGIAQLHSFMYPEAADCFRDAQRADSGFAMAWWAEALTYIHTGWREENPAAARAALERFAPTAEARLARARTPRERLYGVAVEALVAPGASEESRVKGFADGMRAVLAANPADVDAQAFTALGELLVNYLWPAADSATREREHDAAEALAMRVYREHPTHPGGAHYAIHVDDDPRYASRALSAAIAYASIAPDADHALHMPSHVFVQVGMWPEATRSNERAWHASRVRIARRHLTGARAAFHTLNWLQYSYLQQGRYAAARSLLDTARVTLSDAPADFDGSADARFVVNALAFRLAAETGKGWEDVIATAPVEAAGGSNRSNAFATASRYGVAVAHAMLGDSSSARESAAAFRREAGAPDAPPAPRRIRRMMAEHLDALVAQSRGDWTQAAEAFRRAAAIEDSIPPLGPPNFLPSHEWLGAALLQLGRPAEAAAAYKRALVQRPNRTVALRGLAQAYAATHEGCAMATALRAVSANWKNADPGLPRGVIPRSCPQPRFQGRVIH